MTVVEVWGTVDGGDVLPIGSSGDDWYFPLPRGASGQLIVEFWAQDECGNVGYRAAVLTLDKGSVKCWRWMDIGCECTMRAPARPSPDLGVCRPAVEASDIVRGCTPSWARVACDILPHACPVIGG